MATMNSRPGLRLRTTRGAVASLAAFVLTMLVLQAAVANWLAEPRCERLEATWRDFKRQADEYTVIFIGTSHIERHIDPRVVDRTLAEHGVVARSYNFGLPKMSMLEGAALIERLARRRPRNLQLVVVEPTLYLYDADNWATDRAMAEHNLPGTAQAIGMTWSSERRRGTGTWGKLAATWPHVLSFACRSLGLRRGEPLFRASPVTSGIDSGDYDAAGFCPLPVEPGERSWQSRFARFLEIEPDWTGLGLSDQEVAYFDSQLAGIHNAGARPAWLLGPKVKRDSHTAAVLHTHGERYAEVPLLNYLRGCGGSQLYQVGYWHDFDHLNVEGAELFSRQLAADLAELLRR